MDNSLIPRPFSPTDAKRRAEENAREAERRTSARNASSSTIGAGGRLDLAGDINVFDAGVVRVVGQGVNNGVPYEVTAELTNFVDTGQIDYQSPGMLFSSALYGTNVARIYSRDGRTVSISANDDSTKKFAQIDNGTELAGIYLGVGGLDTYETRIQGFQNQINAYLDRSAGTIRAGMHVQDGSTAGGEVRVGHMPQYSSVTKKAQLRTQDGGKLWLESNGAKAAAIVMDGAGNIDIQTTGALTQNGAPISGGSGAVSSVAGKTGAVTLVKADVGLDQVDNTSDLNKPVSNATKSALDGKPAKTRFKKIPGTSLPGTLTATYSSFNSLQTIPADYFGAGVPYLISVYGQIQANPPSGATIVIRALFNGSQPNGAKVNGGAAPNFGVTALQYDYEVTTSTAVTVDVQASSQGANSTRGTGGDEPFYTIKVQPYLAL